MQEEVAGASTQAPFGINPRSAWNARAVGSMSYGSTIKKAVVHHTVSGNSYSQAQVPGIIAGIQAYHLDGRGWSDIGYNFLVDKYGGIWEGRAGGMDRPVIGAHAAGFNTNTVGVSVIGDYTQTSPTAASNEAVARVAGWKLFLGNQEPLATSNFTSGGGPRFPAGTVVNLPNIVGHSDVGSTACPGSVHAALGAIRQRAQEWFVYTREVSGPVGNLEYLGSSGSTVTAVGWTHDLDGDNPVQVRLDAAGRSATTTANGPRPDVQGAYPGYPANTGFNVEVTGVPPGYNNMCVRAINQNYGNDLTFPCKWINVGDPAGTSPTGSIAAANPLTGGVELGGTVRDPNGRVQSVKVEIDGAIVAEAALPSGDLWLARVIGITAGRRRICMIADNVGAGVNTRFDCKWVDIPGASPFGFFDGFFQDGDYVKVSGWVIDPETKGPLSVHMIYDGSTSWAIPANRSRPDVAAIYPDYGPNHGYEFEMRMSKGTHTLCAVAINTGWGANPLLGCRTVTVK